VRTTFHSASAVALALLAASAQAQSPAPARAAGTAAKAAPTPGLGPKKSVAPDPSLGGSLRPAEAPRAAEAAGPALTYEAFRYRVEGQLSGKRREEIADLEKLIQLGGNPTEMPGWLFRLAELDWEESQYYFFEANRKDDALLRLGANPPAAEVQRLQGEKRSLEDRSRAYQDEAIARYKEILQKFPDYARSDEVLFFLGENLWKQGKQKEALAAYKILVTKHEGSRYVPDAWMAFGEHYFNAAEKSERTRNLENALKAYQRAASYKESSVYGFALYKQAWVYYNLARWTDALDLFRAVVIFGELPTTTLTQDKRLALVREARKDYVRTYSHVGSPEAAQEEFRKVGGEANWFEMLRGLADLYYGEGKDREAMLVYRQLIQARPLSAEAPLFQARIVTAAGRLGRKELAVQQARVFVKMLGEVEASGAVKDEKGKKQLEEARAAAENTLRTLAVQYHTEWKKTRDEPVAGLAAEVYEDYLQVFPDAPQAYDMRFFYAELLYALERYARAGDTYTQVALADARKVDAGEKPGKHLLDALEFAVHAYDVPARKFEETEKRAAAADARTPLPIPAPKQQLLDAALRYRKYAPQGPKVVEVTYRAANIYYRYNHLPEAQALFTEIATQHPRSELSGYAANLALDTYNMQGDWKGMNEQAKRLYGNADLVARHPALKDDLARVVEQSAFKVIEQQEKSGQYLAAADAYLAFAREWPQSKLAPTALYNASVDLVAARQLDRAGQVREELVTRYPGGAVVPKVLWANGADFEAIADFEKAADFYERYFEGWRKERFGAAPAAPRGKGKGKAPAAPAAGEPAFEEAKARDALYNAGVFREGLRQLDRAEADRTAYVTAWPDGPDSGRVFLSIADLYARRKDWGKELKQLEEYQRRYGKDPTDWIVAQGRIARAMERAGNSAGARRAWAQALDHYRKTGSKAGERALPVVAWASYLELEPDFERYDRITLDVAPRYLKAQLEVKARKLADLQRRYTEVVNLKQAEAAVCALYRIGDGYRRFSRSLAEAPVPAELKAMRRADVVQEYRAQLLQLSEGPQKKAVEGFDYALAKAREYGIWNECARQSAEALAKLDPERQAAPPEVVPALAGPAPAPVPGHGLLAAVQPPAPPPPADAAPPSLPPLRPVAAGGPAPLPPPDRSEATPVRPAAAPATPAAAAPSAGSPPRAPAPAAAPVPPPRPARPATPAPQPDRNPKPSDRDEDLLQ
jgi:tetratricopeptide (TPR) repeat protein